MSNPSTERAIRDDTLHVGATRPTRFWGLPMPLAIGLAGLGYAIQTNVTGWEGLLWAVAVVGPCWWISYLAVAYDPYGINVAVAWLLTCFLLLDKARWGGPSCSPLPARQRRKRTPACQHRKPS